MSGRSAFAVGKRVDNLEDKDDVDADVERSWAVALTVPVRQICASYICHHA